MSRPAKRPASARQRDRGPEHKIPSALRGHHPVRVVGLEKLKPSPYNPRTISSDTLDGLAASLAKFGLVEPIIWNERTGYIVGGHQRIAALQKHNVKEAQVIVVDLDPRDEKELNLALNQLSGDWDYSKLKYLLEELNVTDAERKMMGFTDQEFDDLLNWTKPNEPLVEGNTDPDDAPEVPKTATTKRGDLYALGDHLLLCGDSCAPTDIERLIKKAGTQADMVFTDPPYGVKFGKTNHNPRAKEWDAIANDEKQGNDLYEFSSQWVASILIAAKDAAPLYCWSPTMTEGFDILKALKDGGIHVQSQLIWVKNTLVLGQADYQWKHENCWYGWKEGKNHFWSGGRALTTVWEFPKDANSSYVHPMQKPVALSINAISNSSAIGSTVLDLFSGSGSTLIGCEQTQRRFIGVELDPKYCDVIVKRWQDFTGEKAELVL